MSEGERNACYVYVTNIFKLLLEEGRINEAECKKIDRYNAEYYDARIATV